MRYTAAPNGSGDAKPPESEKQGSRHGAFGAIRTLRVLLVGTIIVPLLLAAIGGYFSYRASYQGAAAAEVAAPAPVSPVLRPSGPPPSEYIGPRAAAR